MAETIVPRICQASNGYLPVPEIERAGDNMARQTIRDGGIDSILWMRIERLGIPMVILAAIFYLVYAGGSWSGQRLEAGVSWTGEHLFLPLQQTIRELVQQQREDSRIHAEESRLNRQAADQNREALIQNAEAMRLMHQSFQELLKRLDERGP